jgi:predicted amidohydrolase YtcJ
LLDGTIGSHTAALFEPYTDMPDTSGSLYKTQADVDEYYYQARKHGLQASVHAIGGRAIELALRAIERAASLLPDIETRQRIDHYGEASEDQIRRAADLGVCVATQPPFPYLRGGPESIYADRLGPDRVRSVYAFRRMVDAGIHVAGGSDSPVVPQDCILGLHSCVNAHFGSQRLRAEEALRIYTLGSAWAAFEEGKKGDLKKGMNADLVVLDRNPLQIDPGDIVNTRVLLTLKGGEVVHDTLPLTAG